MKFKLTLILFFIVNLVFGQPDNKYMIDIELQKCLDSSENSTTKGMTDCVIQATAKWDKELNKNYQELLTLLTAEQKRKLKVSQREWIEYREKEIEFSNQIYSDIEGTMWIPVSANTKLELTKQRALEILGYKANLSIDK